MAPDALTERFSTRSDIWSLGCVAIELLTGKPPWESEVSDTKGLEYVVSPLYQLKRNPRLNRSPQLREMYETCIVYAPPLPADERLGPVGRAVLLEKIFVRVNKRIGVYSLLEHPWLKNAVSI